MVIEGARIRVQDRSAYLNRRLTWKPLRRRRPVASGASALCASGSASSTPSAILDALKPVLEDPSIEKVGHDLKFDLIVLARQGITLSGLGLDTMLASYLLDSARTGHPLEATALEHLSYKALTEEDVCGRGGKAVNLAYVPVETLLNYAGERADLALQLANRLSPMMTSDGLDALDKCSTGRSNSR